MNYKVVLSYLLALFLSFLFAPLFQGLLRESYDYSGSVFSITSISLDGFLFAYVFFSALIIYLVTNKMLAGVIVAAPVLLFDLFTGALYSHFVIDLILLAAALGLAWLILYLKNNLQKQKGPTE